jgi:hypothetical protein
LGVDSVNTGFSLLDDGAHSPSEKLHLPTFYRGIDALIHFFFNPGEQVAPCAVSSLPNTISAVLRAGTDSKKGSFLNRRKRSRRAGPRKC